MQALKRAIRYVRPCQRALEAIDANLEASQDLQARLNSLETTLIDYVERHGPDPDGQYRRRSEDPTWPQSHTEPR